jgi:uncharacterized membrane protein YbaN (DUF454 family)
MLENRLRQEETEFLQEKIRTNALTEEAVAISKKILTERNAEIPVAETEEEAETKYKSNSKISLILFLLFATYLLVLWFAEYSFARFVLFTIALFGAVAYTRTLRK